METRIHRGYKEESLTERNVFLISILGLLFYIPFSFGCAQLSNKGINMNEEPNDVGRLSDDISQQTVEFQEQDSLNAAEKAILLIEASPHLGYDQKMDHLNRLNEVVIAKLDPNFDLQDSQNIPFINLSPGRGHHSSGVASEYIEDRELRREYEQRIEENRVKRAKYHRQSELQRLRDDIERLKSELQRSD